MSKMSEMAAIIEDLRSAAAAINEAANWLAEQFSGEESSPEKTVPAEPVLTLEAVRAVLADKSRAGFTAQIRSLLQKHGADKLSGIDPANYKALLADVEGLTDAT
ncbi:DNA ligase [Novisyntrophococcus fermenticellae]|uniref:DNA ligase n=1 Tax=Novisyntrophococcus fermenticellae TaxID=2068655 RepID=UPI001E36F1E0|nr:DNA ligase [Novisyntrophococcus fermenticellae]